MAHHNEHDRLVIYKNKKNTISVRICEDRGESDYSNKHSENPFDPHSEVINHASCDGERKARLEALIGAINRELRQKKVRYPVHCHSSFFIPRRELGNIANPRRIREVIDNLGCCGDLTPDERAALCQKTCFGGPTKQCWKLLLVLFQIGQQEQFLQLIDKEKASDQCLPIQMGNNHGQVPPCRVKGHRHPTIDAWLDDHREDASKWSYALKAPYFSRPSGQHTHYILETNDVLPVSAIVQKVPPKHATVTNQETAGDQRVISGGFSEVRIVELDEGHYDFPNLRAWGPQRGSRQFALKRLDSEDSKSFKAELTSLLRIQGHETDESKHLIQLVATFEIREAEGTKYYLLFPCAQGDLWFFWEAHQTLTDEQRIQMGGWMAHQIHQLASSLKFFHNERERHLKQESKRKGTSEGEALRNELYGRHGDMKAENILWFRKETCDGGIEENWLVITDFGLARLNSENSRSGIDPLFVARSETYKAPEFELTDGQLSRVSDIFSFGCTCLEFVTWYLEGWEAVNKRFADYRMEVGIQGWKTDTFFKIEGYEKDRNGHVINKEKQRAVVKPKVKEWIQMLKRSKNSSCYTLQFLELIEKDMLEPVASKRIKSPELVHKLKILAETCKRSPSFYEEYCDELLPPSG